MKDQASREKKPTTEQAISSHSCQNSFQVDRRRMKKNSISPEKQPQINQKKKQKKRQKRQTNPTTLSHVKTPFKLTNDG